MKYPNRQQGQLKIWFWRWLFASFVLLAFVSCSRNVDETGSPVNVPETPATGDLITLHYNERPPYLVTTDDGVGGLTGDPATIAFEKSGIPFQWKQTPTKRQIYILQQNKGRDCLVGWFSNLEREKFARYTLPIYWDKPQVALARADNDKIPVDTTVGVVFSNPKLNLLVKDGYSYGDFLDRKIKQYNPTRTVTTDENSGMLNMVYAKHADYFFIAPEEAEGLIASSAYNVHDFKFSHFSDIPYGEKRYILCSMQVENSVIEQLNAAIRQYVTLPAQ